MKYPCSSAKLLMVDIATTAVLVPLCTSKKSASVTLEKGKGKGFIILMFNSSPIEEFMNKEGGFPVNTKHSRAVTMATL